MKVDQALNLVTSVPVEDSIYPLYVHVTPFPYEVVEQYHEMLATVLSRSYQLLGEMGAIRTCAMQLRKLEKQYHPDQSGPGFFDEVGRLTQIAVMTDGQWRKVSLEHALSNGIISLDDWRDVEGEVCFFIVSSAIQKRRYIQTLTVKAPALFGAQLTPSSFTEYLNSLQKSKTVEPSEAPKPSDPKAVFIPS